MLVIAVATIVYLKHSLLMHLCVALGLHFGRDSQLNTNGMFWIDISRSMISKYMMMNKRSTCIVVLSIRLSL